jgi:predicted Rossmann fold nucleotide-binding protein DprA/Smf involved in DNA uptake
MDRIRGFQAVRTSERHDHTPGPEEQERRVLAVLASGPFDVMEIARRADLSWQAVDETCRRLSLTNLVASVNGYTWKRA